MVATGWMAFLLAALKALPAVISFFAALKGSAEAAKNQGIGYDKAVKDGFEIATARITQAREIEREAARDHATKSDDTAFDQEFRR